MSDNATPETTTTPATTAAPRPRLRQAAPGKSGKPGKPGSTNGALAKTNGKKATPRQVPAGNGEYGVTRSKDLPWNVKKVALFKALKSVKATDPTSAAGSSALAEKSGILSIRDVRHYAYHAAAGGLVGVAKLEGKAGYGFYLTKKGQAIDPQGQLKATTAK